MSHNENIEPIILPTDTLWGVAASYSKEGVKRLNLLKKRPANAPYVSCILKSSWNEFLDENTPNIQEIIEHFWPGKLTIVAPPSTRWKGPESLLKNGKLSVRAPNHPWVIDHISKNGPQLISSCNISGQPPSVSLEEIQKEHKDIPFVAEGPQPSGIDSTVIIFEAGVWKVLRIGAVDIAEIESIIKYRPLQKDPKTPFCYLSDALFSSDGHPMENNISIGWSETAKTSHQIKELSDLYPLIQKLKHQKVWIDTSPNTPFAFVRKSKTPKKLKMVLGVETSCDDSSLALVEEGKKVMGMETKSQYEVHKPYGGVYPELASRSHSQCLVPLLDKLLKKNKTSLDDIDAIAVTTSPGLIGSLLTGVTFAKMLALTLNKPLIPVNHVQAHLYAPHLEHENIPFPSLGVVISGGHTFMAYMQDPIHMTLLGSTADDALGEAFDKVGKLLGWDYPQGPTIEKWAKQGDPLKYKFTPGTVKKNRLAFSYSGLKTQVLYALKGQNAQFSPCCVNDTMKADICASFQHVAFQDVAKKINLALKKHDLSSVIIGGGVAASQTLKNVLDKHVDAKIFMSSPTLSQDNGAMIAGMGYKIFETYGAHPDPASLTAKARSSF